MISSNVLAIFKTSAFGLCLNLLRPNGHHAIIASSIKGQCFITWHGKIESFFRDGPCLLNHSDCCRRFALFTEKPSSGSCVIIYDDLGSISRRISNLTLIDQSWYPVEINLRLLFPKQNIHLSKFERVELNGGQCIGTLQWGVSGRVGRRAGGILRLLRSVQARRHPQCSSSTVPSFYGRPTTNIWHTFILRL